LPEGMILLSFKSSTNFAMAKLVLDNSTTASICSLQA